MKVDRLEFAQSRLFGTSSTSFVTDSIEFGWDRRRRRLRLTTGHRHFGDAPPHQTAEVHSSLKRGRVHAVGRHGRSDTAGIRMTSDLRLTTIRENQGTDNT